ncbi:MAG: hypothetical protein CUN51_00755 [Candidatus Thermofonsia Clade 1 bacterium]|uniref:Uncharacterized protein n=1 Tax=Candidatus Thermofonsia Clade 1 bacterium TaxID=2364210 RepID=A0A2M8P3R6_9CHLR|nr:MAG: hypothetical protein CUN51_00755 [Candidatus Thermofonsia Clade 1 bacterium]
MEKDQSFVNILLSPVPQDPGRLEAHLQAQGVFLVTASLSAPDQWWHVQTVPGAAGGYTRRVYPTGIYAVNLIMSVVSGLVRMGLTERTLMDKMAEMGFGRIYVERNAWYLAETASRVNAHFGEKSLKSLWNSPLASCRPSAPLLPSKRAMWTALKLLVSSPKSKSQTG